MPLTTITRYPSPSLQDAHLARTEKQQVSPGNTYDYAPYNDSAASALYSTVYGSGGCVEQLNNCVNTGTNAVCAAADNFCLLNVENFYDQVTGRDEDDIRELEPDP